ncbi:MAG: TlpA disulfide reductase family protein [Gemmataceae bacterium]
MQRLAFTALFGAATLATAVPPDRMAEFDAFQKSFAAIEGPVKKASDDRPFDLAKRDALDKLHDEYAAKAFDFAKRAPADASAAVAAAWAARHSIDDSPRFAEIARFLRDHQFGNPATVDAFNALSFDAEGRKFLAETLAKATDRTARGRACEGLARYELRGMRDPKAPAAERDAHARKAEEYLERLIREFDTVKTKFRGVPIGEADFAQAGLFQVRTLGVGKPAPEAASIDLDGKPVKLTDLRGKVVLLSFWATWCPPCRKLVPFERELNKRYADKPFALVSVSCDEDRSDVVGFVKKHDMSWTHWYSGPAGLHLAWGATSIPTLYLVDAKGVIRFASSGEEGEEKELAKAVEAVVAETKR